MKTGLYVGSFNPWHKGHEDVLKKALEVFDKVHVVKMLNPEKGEQESEFNRINGDSVTYSTFSGTLKHSVDIYEPTAIIRGLRNGQDLEYEKNQQYWNEDVGIEIPFVYFITDRSLSHVSSSSIRVVEELGLSHDY